MLDSRTKERVLDIVVSIDDSGNMKLIDKQVRSKVEIYVQATASDGRDNWNDGATYAASLEITKKKI